MELKDSLEIGCLFIHLSQKRDTVEDAIARLKWSEGDCMGRMYPAAHKRFMKLSLDTKLTVFSDILNFFEYIASQKYIAIVFL